MPRQSAFAKSAFNSKGYGGPFTSVQTVEPHLLRLLAGNSLSAAPQASTGQRRLDFATQDHLGLSAHPALRAHLQAAKAGSTRKGHAANPDPTLSATLRARVSSLLGLPATALFSSGALAIRQTLSGILSPDDNVLVDAGAPPEMCSAVLASGARLHLFPAGSILGVERRLARLARQSRKGRLVVATASVSDSNARLANLADLSAIARRHHALLVVDGTHDFGTFGHDGSTSADLQRFGGGPDVILGSFHASFVADGGFAAFRDPDLAARVPGGDLMAVHCNMLLQALDIAFGPEGPLLHRNLHDLAVRLRNHLMADGIRILGGICPFVPIPLPPVTALPRTALLESTGTKVTLLMPPRVPVHAPRWRISLSAKHTAADIDDLAGLIHDVTRAFDRRSATVPVGA